ncbi:MAG: hypothetical protein Q8O00_07680, partial [Holophaga sp.]|nr:hypothetical protein [Holophaga sp.]
MEKSLCCVSVYSKTSLPPRRQAALRAFAKKSGGSDTPKGRPCRIFGQKSAFLGADFWPKIRSAA